LYAQLAGFPPALMVVGTLDPLLDDTVQMAARWQAVAPVELHVIPEAPHGFIHFPTPLAPIVLAYVQTWIAARIDARRDETRTA
jgi:acetyl esterase/lipase